MLIRKEDISAHPEGTLIRLTDQHYVVIRRTYYAVETYLCQEHDLYEIRKMVPGILGGAKDYTFELSVGKVIAFGWVSHQGFLNPFHPRHAVRLIEDDLHIELISNKNIPFSLFKNIVPAYKGYYGRDYYERGAVEANAPKCTICNCALIEGMIPSDEFDNSIIHYVFNMVKSFRGTVEYKRHSAVFNTPLYHARVCSSNCLDELINRIAKEEVRWRRQTRRELRELDKLQQCHELVKATRKSLRGGDHAAWPSLQKEFERVANSRK